MYKVVYRQQEFIIIITDPLKKRIISFRSAVLFAEVFNHKSLLSEARRKIDRFSGGIFCVFFSFFRPTSAVCMQSRFSHCGAKS